MSSLPMCPEKEGVERRGAVLLLSSTRACACMQIVKNAARKVTMAGRCVLCGVCRGKTSERERDAADSIVE
eukprot:3128795-Rhodomonas_salina.2